MPEAGAGIDHARASSTFWVLREQKCDMIKNEKYSEKGGVRIKVDIAIYTEFYKGGA